MKKYLILIGLSIFLFFNSKTIQIEPTLVGIPAEHFLLIADQLLKQSDLEKVINSLNALSTTNKKFRDIVMSEQYFKLFFELSKIQNPIKALRLVYDNPPLQSYKKNGYFFEYDWAEYLHNKFPYLSAEAFQTGFPLFNRDEADRYLSNYESTYGWNELRNQYINIFGNPLDAYLAGAIKDNDIENVFYLLIVGANPNAVDENGIKIVVYAAINKNVDILKLLMSTGALISDSTIQNVKNAIENSKSKTAGPYWQIESEELKNLIEAIPILEKYKNIIAGKGYVSRRLLEESKKEGLRGIFEPQKKRFWEFWK